MDSGKPIYLKKFETFKSQGSPTETKEDVRVFPTRILKPTAPIFQKGSGTGSVTERREGNHLAGDEMYLFLIPQRNVTNVNEPCCLDGIVLGVPVN